MQVVIEGEASEKVTADSSVPQGTVLGPILFLCHIEDQPQAVTSQVCLFADDCLLYGPIKSQTDHISLKNDFTQLEKLADKWGIRFNAKKCYIMSINNHSTHFYSLNNIETGGLTLSENLKWSSHVTKITSKANFTDGFLEEI